VSELRWVLVGVGLLALAGVYVYSRYRASRPAVTRRAQERREPVLDEQPSEPVPVEQTPSLPPNPEKVLTIRLLSRDKQGFPAEKLVLALREAKLRHGRFGIFHCHDEAHPSEAVFSVASLTEPGSFDLTALKTARYPGVSLFMVLPGPMEGVAAFDLMMGVARNLARSLEGDLSDEQGSTLSVQRERYLREEIIQFQHRQPEA
jgi:cell division protein ZipA